MRWLLQLTQVPQNGLVIDPFLGSGTSAIAFVKQMVAQGLDYRFMGIEMDPTFYQIAENRTRYAIENPSSFAETSPFRKVPQVEYQELRGELSYLGRVLSSPAPVDLRQHLRRKEVLTRLNQLERRMSKKTKSNHKVA